MSCVHVMPSETDATGTSEIGIAGSTSGAGATTSVTGVAVAAVSNVIASAPTAAAPASDVEPAINGVAPVPDVVDPATGPESVVSSVASAPSGAFVWLVVPVEGCLPELRLPSLVSVPPDVFFFFVVGCWSESLVPSPLCAVVSLEGGLAKETAASGAPINRPATSTQTPAAKRKCDGTMICPPPGKEPPDWSIVAVPWVPRESVGQKR